MFLNHTSLFMSPEENVRTSSQLMPNSGDENFFLFKAEFSVEPTALSNCYFLPYSLPSCRGKSVTALLKHI